MSTSEVFSAPPSISSACPVIVPANLLALRSAKIRDHHLLRKAVVYIGCDRASAKDFHEIRAVFTRGVA